MFTQFQFPFFFQMIVYDSQTIPPPEILSDAILST